MAKIKIVQSYNGGTRYAGLDVDCDTATAEAIIALMPKGVTVYDSDGTTPVGTRRAVPSHYSTMLVTCKDSGDDTASPSFIGINYGKPRLSSKIVKQACVGVVKLQNNQACDAISVGKYDIIGASAPTV